MNGDSAPADVRLTCQPSRDGQALVFPYEVQNHGPTAIWLMEALPSVDPATKAPRADDRAAVVMQGPEDRAIVGKFIAPLPTDRRIAVVIIPLARQVLGGETVRGLIEVPLPLAEISPYFGDLPLRRYEAADIKGIELCIGYWVAGADGCVALPASHAPSLLRVISQDPTRGARMAAVRFATRGLQLFRRLDAFPRTMPP